MHPKPATLMLLSGALLLSGCESTNLGQRATTAPPPSEYETVTPPIMQTTPPGNGSISSTGTVASTAPQPPFRPVRSRVVSHTVTPGESLWSLSRKFETTIDEIREANQIEGDIIRAGQTLKIPTSMPEEQAAPSPAQSAENRTLPPAYPGPSTAAPSSSWTVTPPVTPPTSSGSAAPQYRIPEPMILPPPGNY